MKISHTAFLSLALALVGCAGQAEMTIPPRTSRTATPIAPETALTILNHWRALPKNTHFEKWFYDMWAFNTATCMRESGQNSPLDLAAFKPHFSGSFSLPSSIPGMCNASAKGPNPICYRFNSRQPPFTMPSEGLSSDYTFVGEKDIEGGTPVTVGGYCQLVLDEPDTKQFYVGPAVFRWNQPLAMRSLNTPSGERTILMGNAEFETSAPGVHPVLVVRPLAGK